MDIFRSVGDSERVSNFICAGNLEIRTLKLQSSVTLDSEVPLALEKWRSIDALKNDIGALIVKDYRRIGASHAGDLGLAKAKNNDKDLNDLKHVDRMKMKFYLECLKLS